MILILVALRIDGSLLSAKDSDHNHLTHALDNVLHLPTQTHGSDLLSFFSTYLALKLPDYGVCTYSRCCIRIPILNATLAIFLVVDDASVPQIKQPVKNI